MLSYIDRANVGNAKLFGAQKDTGLTNTGWNIGLSLLCEFGLLTVDVQFRDDKAIIAHKP